MEPLETKITTYVYDTAGNRSLAAHSLQGRVAKEGTGPVVTNTYDPNSSTPYLRNPDAPGGDGEVRE